MKTETKLAEKISAAAVFELATFGFKDHRANHYATSTVDFPYTRKSYRLTRELPETNEQNLLDPRIEPGIFGFDVEWFTD